eukprot:jgi/Botrbrau1/3935/Bobra.0365s0011.2
MGPSGILGLHVVWPVRVHIFRNRNEGRPPQNTTRNLSSVGRFRVFCSTLDGQGGRLFIFGMGYTSLGIANLLRKQGWHVAGTFRADVAKTVLDSRKIAAYFFDPNNMVILSGAGLRELEQATHVLSSIPPVGDFDADPVLASHSLDLCQLAVPGRGPGLRWAGYLSSTFVYGDWGGAWVDERSEARATDRKALARREAERQWLALQADCGLPSHIFRLGGIYGPGRSALDTLKSGGPGSASQQRRAVQQYINRCHVLDICRVLAASMSFPQPGEIYNVVDDDPAPRAEVLAFGRELLGLPDLETPPPSPLYGSQQLPRGHFVQHALAQCGWPGGSAIRCGAW